MCTVPESYLPWALLGSCIRYVAFPLFFQVTQSSKSYVDLSKAIRWEDKQVIAVVGQMSTDMLAFFSKVPDFCRMPVSVVLLKSLRTFCYLHVPMPIESLLMPS